MKRTLTAGTGMVQVSATRVISQRQYQIDVTHGTLTSEVHTTDADGRDISITFKAPAAAERYSQRLATVLRAQGHRVFRTIQS
jgi:hypothetical protein